MEYFIFYRLITEMYCVPATSLSEAKSLLDSAADLEDWACHRYYQEPSDMIFMDKCQSDVCARRKDHVACRQD